ncbi:MAG: glycan-binding surface protein [Candidatus Azobacteroides sp.]|nr:glycan-binding surface protein [Candidatus Azobacteroides sp.]
MKNKYFIKSLLFFGLIAAVFSFNSCKDNDENGGNTSKPVINAVYLEDAQSSVSDRLVDFARLGQTIRLEGESFLGVNKLFINGFEALFNPMLMTNTSMIIQISSKVPTIDVPDDVRNTIRLEKSESNYIVYNFEIRAAAPTITAISHTMPQAGDRITVTGTGLQEITSVTFPGNKVVTSGIVSDDEDGLFFTVTVPDGVADEGGSILAVGANGGAYSPACFNFKVGLLQNFDDVTSSDKYSRGSVSDDLSAAIPSTSGVIHSQGNYRSFNTPGSTVAASNSEVGAYFMTQDTWGSALPAIISPALSTSDVAIQMDIYVAGEWNSGYLRMVIADGWGVGRYDMVYEPIYSNGKKVEFNNPGGWFTVTFPFSGSPDFAGLTFNDVLAQAQAAVTDKYNQWGPWFCNDDHDGVASESTNVVIYFDNIRVVPLTIPAYSDFPDK